MFFMMFLFVFLASLAIFGNVFYVIFRQKRTIGKMFELNERELDRRLNEHRREEPKVVVCGHCGGRVTTGEDCPKSGAPAQVRGSSLERGDSSPLSFDAGNRFSDVETRRQGKRCPADALEKPGPTGPTGLVSAPRLR